MGGHSLLMFSRLTFLLSLLKALSASTNNRHSLLSSSKLFLFSAICLLLNRRKRQVAVFVNGR